MSALDIIQNITEQLSKLPSEQVEAVENYLRELSEMETEPTEIVNQYLIFRCDTLLFAIGIGQVTQIVQMTHITPLPDSPPHMKGVLSLRGEMVPVMDMRLRLHREESAYTEQTCIIILHIQERPFGLIVDAVSNVESIAQQDILPAPQQARRNTDYLTGIVQREEPILLLDVNELLAEEGLDSILELS